MKTRKISLRFKILIPAILVNILACITLSAILNSRAEDSLVQMGREQAEMCVYLVSDDISGDMLMTLRPGDEETERYRGMVRVLKEIMDGSSIRFLYTLYNDNGVIKYGVDASEESAIGDVFEMSYEDLQPAFEGAELSDETIMENVHGDLLTAYTPIYNNAGKVVALLAADYDATGIINHNRENTRVSMIVTAVVVVISMLLLSLIINSVIRNLSRVNGKLYELASNEGDLTQTIDINSGDELELISGNINRLLQYIHGIMLQISAGSEKLDKSSGQIVNNISNAGDHISDVSATMEEMSAAMEETTASISQIDEAMKEIYDFIREISSQAIKGNEFSNMIRENAVVISEEAIQASDTAKEKSVEMEQSIREKIEKSKAVEQITELTANIISITKQTNLLSLNASIEAARAGEAGHGFAVVADEIGKLASTSASTATQIKTVSETVINAVKELAEEAAAMMELMHSIMDNGYGKLVSTGESYSSDADKINHMMQVFAGQASKLQNNMDQMQKAISDVSIAVAESAKGVESVSEMSADLSDNMGELSKEAEAEKEIATELGIQVGKFKL